MMNAISEKARAAAGTSRITAMYLKDRVQGLDRPARPGEVPSTPASLTPQWLTAALCANSPHSRVVDFEIVGGSDGTSSRRVIDLSYNPAGRDAGLPTRVFSKSTPTLTTRLVGGLSHLLVNEINFYAVIRPDLDLETPKGYYAGFDPRSCRSLILIEDISVTRGATFGDPLTRRLDRDQAEDMVNLLARLHSSWWDSPRLGGLTWLLGAQDWQVKTNNMINMARMARRGLARCQAVVPAALVERRDDIWPALLRSLQLHDEHPKTLLHQDVHAGNWYVTGDGRMGLYDWQCTATGCWALDFAYALLSGLTVEDRRAWEHELLGLYLLELKDHGIDAPSFDDAWRSYRQQTLHGLFFWLATIGVGTLQPQMQPTDICLANLERMGQAIEDLDPFTALT